MTPIICLYTKIIFDYNIIKMDKILNLELFFQRLHKINIVNSIDDVKRDTTLINLIFKLSSQLIESKQYHMIDFIFDQIEPSLYNQIYCIILIREFVQHKTQIKNWNIFVKTCYRAFESHDKINADFAYAGIEFNID